MSPERGRAFMDGQAEHLNFDLRMAARLRRMGPFGAFTAIFVFATVLVGPPVAALLVFVWAWLSRTPVAEIGLKRPGSWLGVLVVGVLGGIALKLAMKGVVLPYFGAPATAPVYQELRGDLNA